MKAFRARCASRVRRPRVNPSASGVAGIGARPAQRGAIVSRSAQIAPDAGRRNRLGAAGRAVVHSSAMVCLPATPNPDGRGTSRRNVGVSANDVPQATGSFPDLPEGDGFDAPHGHRVWWAEGGDPQGQPVVIVHGGPGGRSRAETLTWWQGLPVRWIVVDQRGCGRSAPAGALEGNTLDGLLDDLDTLRTRLGLERWAIAGGSWGALVALASWLREPARVDGLFLRSPFLGTPAEVERYLAPWDDWLGAAGQVLLGADAGRLRRWLRGGDRGAAPGDAQDDEAQDEARLADAWGGFDDLQSQPGGVLAGASRWVPAPQAPPPPSGWRVFRHYARQGWGLREPLLEQMRRLPPSARTGPWALLCGDADACCDPRQVDVLAAWRGAARRRRVAGGGHRMDQPAMRAALQALAAQWVADLRA